MARILSGGGGGGVAHIFCVGEDFPKKSPLSVFSEGRGIFTVTPVILEVGLSTISNFMPTHCSLGGLNSTPLMMSASTY